MVAKRHDIFYEVIIFDFCIESEVIGFSETNHGQTQAILEAQIWLSSG